MATKYRHDRSAWSEEQARLLRERRFKAIDRANVAAEIERLGADDPSTLRERIRVLLTALLRWAYQADLRSTALASTITAQRGEIERILDDSQSLRALADEFVTDMYPEAKRLAVVESGLFEDSFPEGLPFLPGEVFDLYFLPDPFNEDEGRLDAWWRDRRAKPAQKD